MACRSLSRPVFLRAPHPLASMRPCPSCPCMRKTTADRGGCAACDGFREICSERSLGRQLDDGSGEGFARDVAHGGNHGVRRSPKPSSSRCACPTISARSSAKAPSNAAFIPPTPRPAKKTHRGGHLFASRSGRASGHPDRHALLALAFIPWLVSALAPGEVGYDPALRS